MTNNDNNLTLEDIDQLLINPKLAEAYSNLRNAYKAWFKAKNEANQPSKPEEDVCSMKGRLSKQEFHGDWTTPPFMSNPPHNNIQTIHGVEVQFSIIPTDSQYFLKAYNLSRNETIHNLSNSGHFGHSILSYDLSELKDLAYRWYLEILNNRNFNG